MHISKDDTGFEEAINQVYGITFLMYSWLSPWSFGVVSLEEKNKTDCNLIYKLDHITKNIFNVHERSCYG
jgi:hypothetical protein